MLVSFWDNFLFTPLLNALMILYSGPAELNLGYAVIILTLILRAIILPLNIISLRSQETYAGLEKKLAEIRAIYKNDQVLMNERLRAVLKKNKVSPWAKFLSLGTQVVVFILLYQVFINGITRSKLDLLYPGVYRPDVINTDFYGFDLGSHSLFWSGLVALILFSEIYLEQRRRQRPVTQNEAIYGILFPLIVFLVLLALPMVKSLFVLTSLIFSYTLFVLVRPKPKEAQAGRH